MNRLDRIERTIAESDAVDRGFPLAKPALARISVHREDLRALVRLARVVKDGQNPHIEWPAYADERNAALAALEEPCEQ